MTRIISARSTQPIPEFWQEPADFEPALLHEFFEQAAARWPDHIAIDTPPSSTRSARRTITYSELDRQATDLARFLCQFVKEECVIAILLPRSSEHLYLAQLAVLKAGAAYTCIDPAFPDEQVDNILSDSQAVAVLGDAAGVARTRRLKHDIECTLDVIAWLNQGLDSDFAPFETAPWLTPNSLAYIIYTSGTTGKPKGVMIEHGGIVNLVQGDLNTLGITPHDRCGQSASCAYDSSVEEIWFAFANGATLVTMDDETTRLGPDLIAWLRREKVTLAAPTPTLMRALGCERPDIELPELRLIHTGGEALPADVAARWSVGRRLVNDYGPTETTVTALRGQIKPGEPVNIGKPVPGVKAWVLNEHLEEVADGEQGELCLGGIALARGYMNDPAMTARKFPTHPRFGRIYRTGDLVYRGADGKYYCHGRIDAQVKIRGYRIELAAIETRLVECAGVREAACRVQGEGAQAKIVAFIVPDDRAAPPDFEMLKNALGKALPIYMVPSFFGLLDRLPTSISGKLDRKALPILEVHLHETNGYAVPPRNAMEEKLASAIQSILKMTDPVSVEDDFFRVLGGDSLLAAQLISKLRDDPATASLTVRDLYEARTVAALAKRTGESPVAVRTEPNRQNVTQTGKPVLATIMQTAWLVLGLMLGAPLAYGIVFHAIPALADSLGLVLFLLLAPVFYFAGLVGYTFLSVGLAVAVKKALIGRYQPTRAPIWGSFYVRNWMVQQTLRLVPWQLLKGTVFQHTILRLLGARIGQRVHIHRGVNLLQGGWDLLDIGDDVTLSQDAALRLVELEAGQIIVGPITIGSGCTLDIRAGVADHTVMEANASLAPLSFLTRGSRIPAGERWDGVPAKNCRLQIADCRLNEAHWSPMAHGFLMILGHVAVTAFVALPLEALAIVFALVFGLDADGAVAWLLHPAFDWWMVLLGVALVIAYVPLTVTFQAIAMRLLGRVSEGTISRWSLAYVRVWLKTGIVESASHWLSGTLLWPVWLRFAGMKIGKGSEISTIIDTVPELVEIGSQTFFADGIYLCGPRIHQGTVTLAPVKLGANTFLGNHAVILAGQSLPDDILLGVCTVADDTKVRPGTSWFGHPPFELPKREVVECDRSLTHEPTWFLWLARLGWELARFTLPFAPVILGLIGLSLLAQAEEAVSLPVLLLVVLPALELGYLASLCAIVLLTKWLLLGRVRPGQHPLYSSWCSRWDFHYVVWDFLGLGPLSALEGTLLLNGYLRAMGMKIGKRVALGNGFAHVVDPDMLEFEDGATVSCQFQAHTFEDRVLKIDYVWIRKQSTVGHLACLLYGADIGTHSTVAPHSVVMKRERLLPDLAYAGCPTRLLS
jgi:non-ribosomal peptide synthetase-like protein